MDFSDPQGESHFLRHEACESCGSSDGKAVYSDGHSYCFVCKEHGQGKNTKKISTLEGLVPLEELEFKALEKRRISEKTCRIYRYGIWYDKFDQEHKQIACYVDPKKGEIVGQKVRGPKKNFRVYGKLSKQAPLFGQSLFKGGRQVVVCEGEIDTLSMAELQDCKWPVVGIPNGTDGAAQAVAHNIEFLESFEKVVFMFDPDEQGQKAARQCAELLSPGKAHIATLGEGDVNEMLVNRKGDAVITAMWNAAEFRPDDLAFRGEIFEQLSKNLAVDSEPYPWADWNVMTHGIRTGELVMFTAGTGVGKTTAMRFIVYHLSRKAKVAYIALEESVKQSALGFIGIHVGKPLHLKMTLEEHELRKAFDETFVDDNIVLYDHFGSLDVQRLLAKVRFLAKAGYKYIILDHLTLMMSGTASQGDERKRIDEVMTYLRSMIASLDIAVLAVCHPRRGDGKGKSLEEGGRVSLDMLRGTSQIAALSDIVIGLERDQQGSEPNVVTARLLKNRFSGVTGVMGKLKFLPDEMKFVTYRDPLDPQLTDPIEPSRVDF